MRNAQRGQAALIAVVGLIILAIGMYASYNLSKAVYEKIKLQNAVDAAAYSQAVLEARTFNFIAFANRAQIANYVQMLEAQSILSSATFVEGYTAWAGDFALWAAQMFHAAAIVACPFTWATGGCVLETVSITLRSVGDSLKAAYLDALKPLVDAMEGLVPGYNTRDYIRVMTSKNQALFGVTAMLVGATAARLADGARDIVAANDSGARIEPIGQVLSAVNLASFLGAFDAKSLSPQNNAEASRAMAELVHASRYASQAQADFLVAREPFAQLEELVGAMGLPMGEAGVTLVGAFLPNFVAPDFVGTSKLLTAQAGDAEVADTGDHAFEHSDLSRGNALSAKDTPRGWNWDVPFASVVSTPQSGQHCRYEMPADYGSANPAKGTALLLGKDFKCHAQGHRWESLVPQLAGGIQPYLAFASDGPNLSVAQGGFNQPEVWVWLTKRAESMAGPADLRFAMGSAELDTRIGAQGVFGSEVLTGMHAIARAQVYYHRPGAWQEPPNFFNPYWDARLAPKGDAIDRLLDAITLPAPLRNVIADNIWMH